MYDTVDMFLSNKMTPNIDFMETVPQFLTVVSNHGENNFGKYVSGYLDSLKVTITKEKVKIHNCSLCKYFYGNNFETLTIIDTKQVIEKISDCLHLPISLSEITRIDVADNLIMQYNENLYYQYLGESQYYKRLEQNNGLYFNNHKRQLVFYGKVHEQKAKRQIVPISFKNSHVLRYELRFVKQLKSIFNEPKITAQLLYDEIFFNKLVSRWNDEYIAIQKINIRNDFKKTPKNKNELMNTLASIAVSDIGQPFMLGKIKEWQKKNEIDKKQAYEYRKYVKELSVQQHEEIDIHLIDELSHKINEVACKNKV